MSSSKPTTSATDPSTTESTTIATLEHTSWKQLTAAIHDEDAPFRFMTVATCTNQGADARMVVLRYVDETRKYVWFHTDARSAKVLQLEAFPNATLLFWDQKQKIQLRLIVETRLHTDDYVADDQWNELPVSSRKMYLSELRPGTEQEIPYPGYPKELQNRLPDKEESEAGRSNFAVIECRVLEMDYLHLSREGQTRARFQYEPTLKLVWLAP